MTWKPSTGLMRAIAVTNELLDAGEACDVVIKGDGYAVYRQRMTEVIAKAIDQALADGSGKSRTDQMIEGAPSWEEIHAKHGNGNAAPWGTRTTAWPVTAIESEEGPRDAVTVGGPFTKADAEAMAGPALTGMVGTVPDTASTPKKRGRPPGPGKKKKAKRKSAKAIRAELYPVEAPPVEVAPVEVAPETPA